MKNIKNYSKQRINWKMGKFGMSKSLNYTKETEITFFPLYVQKDCKERLALGQMLGC
jgi:hypothetical protein